MLRHGRVRSAPQPLRDPLRTERGAALLIVLIALVGLTALAAAGLVITETDVRMSENQEASTNAFYAADAGVRQYLGTLKTPAASASYTLADGTATVTATRLADLGDDRLLYRITSVGAYQAPSGATATRTISVNAVYSTGEIDVPGAFTSPNGLMKNGGSGKISGHDWAEAGDAECPNSPGPAKAGVTVPPSSYVQNGGDPVPDGDPPIDDTRAASELLDGTNINWEAVTAGQVSPDFQIPPDSWPDFGSMAADEWPLIYVDGNYAVTPSQSGRGTLVVRGNLSMGGSFDWDGVLLVGGYITSNGYQTIEGATMSGLNLLIDESVASSDIGNGNKEFKYNSCKLKKAATRAFGGFAEVPGTWSERI